MLKKIIYNIAQNQSFVYMYILKIIKIKKRLKQKQFQSFFVV